MEWIAAMQQAITYMEEHLLEEINYEDVAKHVHTSCYEFHRAFSFLCPWQLVKSLKPMLPSQTLH